MIKGRYMAVGGLYWLKWMSEADTIIPPKWQSICVGVYKRETKEIKKVLKYLCACLWVYGLTIHLKY